TFFDQMQNLVMAGDGRFRHVAEVPQKSLARPSLAKCKCAQYKVMQQHPPRAEQSAKMLVGAPNVLDPNRCVDQNHPILERRRGAAFAPGPLPPRRASLRAASI